MRSFWKGYNIEYGQNNKQMNKEERKKEALDKIEELKKLIEQIDNEGPDIPSWEESILPGVYIDVESDIIETKEPLKVKENKNVFATKKQAEAMLAFAQLTQIHQEIVKRNCPGYSTDHGGPSVVKWEGELSVRHFFRLLSPLPLPSYELAQAFLEKHRNLWTTFWEGMS